MEDKIENEKRHKYRKMQGMQICDDTGNTKSKEAQISKGMQICDDIWAEDKQWEATS